MTPELCRQARELLGWSEQYLATIAGCSRQTIVNLESGRNRPYGATVVAIRSALGAAGVEFTEPEAGGAGIRLRKAAL
ncbi:helix-turn-helix transcriptional regulator [Pararoseomonas indoligenes]|uniref:Helix-turn-helix transcriptional regulator n=1 Tax=Roseomonas indoligenes TaxID=2820811 RepID=A0A940MR19_9PROT|nr:helix-turn-helix transcriptional regulator [Pararoseomonas indoligenes]MBP0492453.1 helix-turn-helix transcriptional regulator [Pararoseomonas indoligenes]